MIGGAVWKITKDSEEVVYAVDYNHAQERLLDGTVLVDLPRPSILITDAYTVLDKPFSGGKRAREGMLIDEVMRTVSRGGNVLLPVDSVGRVFELMVVLDQYWAHHNLQQYTLAFLSSESRSIVDMAASQTEWLSKHVSQMFIQNRSNIFHFKHLKRCCTRRQLAGLPGPQVVLNPKPQTPNPTP
jgi:cleavage and polyadenylation specificity factor subunit 2